MEDMPVRLPRPRDRQGAEYYKRKDHLSEALRGATGKRAETYEATSKPYLAALGGEATTV